VLLIGDRAIHVSDGDFVEEWDLGDQWCRWSELPFVFAMWVARREVDTATFRSALEQARDEGVANLSAIAAQEAAVAGLGEEVCLSYLRDNLYFYLGARERSGLELFRQHAIALGIAPVDASCS
jgi:chorismate dehydratase